MIRVADKSDYTDMDSVFRSSVEALCVRDYDSKVLLDWIGEAKPERFELSANDGCTQYVKILKGVIACFGELSANSSSTSCQAYYKKTAYIYLEKKNKSFFCNTSINDIQIVACSSVTTSNCYVTTYDDSGNISNLNLNVDSSESIYNIRARISHGNSNYSLLYILSVPWDIVTLPVQAVGLGIVFIYVLIADDGWS